MKFRATIEGEYEVAESEMQDAFGDERDPDKCAAIDQLADPAEIITWLNTITVTIAPV